MRPGSPAWLPGPPQVWRLSAIALTPPLSPTHPCSKGPRRTCPCGSGSGGGTQAVWKPLATMEQGSRGGPRVRAGAMRSSCCATTSRLAGWPPPAHGAKQPASLSPAVVQLPRTNTRGDTEGMGGPVRSPGRRSNGARRQKGDAHACGVLRRVHGDLLGRLHVAHRCLGGRGTAR